MLGMTAGTYSISGRRAITQVSVSKLIDVYGHNMSNAVKEKVSSWLADITKMNSSDYFDPKTHRGFLIKDIYNRRRKLPASDKRWVWSKKVKTAADIEKVAAQAVKDVCLPGNRSLTAADSIEESLLELDGCPRLVSDCEYCQGKCAFCVFTCARLTSA
jgi:hypothetical protein